MEELGFVKKVFEVIWETVGLPDSETVILYIRKDVLSVSLLANSVTYYSEAFFNYEDEQKIDQKIEKFKEAYAEFEKIQKNG